MARITFGGTASDFVAAIGPGGTLRVATATLTFWDAETGGTQHTDLLLDGTPVTSIAVPAGGQIPDFQGPDGVTEMWADAGFGQRTRFATGPPGPPGAPGGSDAATADHITNGELTPAALSATYALKPDNAARAVGQGELVLNVKDYGAVGDGITDDTAAVASAKAALPAAGGTLRFPRGTYKLTSDLTLTADGQSIEGDGEGSHLAFVAAGLVVDGSTAHRLRNTIKGLRISRTGTAGPALYFKGGGAATGAARFNVIDVHVSASTGSGLKIAGSYTAAILGCYFRGCAIGVETDADPIAGTIYGNLLTFVGGEIQGNAVGAVIRNPAGVNFFGVGIEGNTTSGLEVPANPRNVGLYGCYFEANAGWDIKFGTNTAGGFGLVVKGCYFSDAGIGKTASIILIRGYSIAIEDCSFLQYGANSPVSVQEVTGGGVRGHARNNSTNGSVAVLALNGATLFNGSYLGSDTSAPVKRHLTGSAVLDFPSLVAGASANLTMTVTGAASGDDVTVHPNALPEAGLIMSAAVTGADTVTVRCTNASTGTIDPAARTWRARVWRS